MFWCIIIMVFLFGVLSGGLTVGVTEKGKIALLDLWSKIKNFKINKKD